MQCRAAQPGFCMNVLYGVWVELLAGGHYLSIIVKGFASSEGGR